jgi:imidazole glycerol phosphate synthase subunit HisF
MRNILKLVVYDNLAYATKRFEKNVYLGSICSILRIASESDFDEILICDPLKELVRNPCLANLMLHNSLIPLSISASYDLTSYHRVLSDGYDKVCIPYEHFMKNRNSITNLIGKFGRQAVSLVIDYEIVNETRLLYSRNSERSHIDILKLDYQNLSDISELVLQNVDRDGALVGLDYKVLEPISIDLNRPIILTGGFAGEPIPSHHKGRNQLSIASSTYFSTSASRSGARVSLLKAVG